MKATTWLCPVLTLLCATKLVYTAQRGPDYGSYPAIDGIVDSNMLQSDYFLAKRNKPSLSIVNPLDVLRQRLLLEIARRQMKENTRQVELNRAILKNVGKRMLTKQRYTVDAAPATWDPLNLPMQNVQLSANGQQDATIRFPNYNFELMPTTSIFDYMQRQRPWSRNERPIRALDNYDSENNDDVMTEEADAIGKGELDDDVVMGLGLGLGNDIKLAMPTLNGHKAVDYDDHRETTVKKLINRSGHESGSNGNDEKSDALTPLKHHKAYNNNDFKLNNLTTMELNEAQENANDHNKNMNNDDYQVQRYLYHLHKNHLARK